MHREAREELKVRLKLAVIEYADHFGVMEACWEFNAPRSSFYRWKQKYDPEGQFGLYRERPTAYSHPYRTSPEIIKKILKIRTDYVLPGPLRWNREPRIHSEQGIENPWNNSVAQDRAQNHVQSDAKLLQLRDREGRIVKLYQYTAINDATRIRALQVFPGPNRDRGHEFQARFHCHVEDQEMRHVYIKPQHRS